jgi:exodeoxyribonuclease VII small subunit
MTDTSPTETFSYEAALAELEAIVAALETNRQNLEEAVKLYERGQWLARYCAETLDKAELKVQQLANGALTDIEVTE